MSENDDRVQLLVQQRNAAHDDALRIGVMLISEQRKTAELQAEIDQLKARKRKNGGGKLAKSVRDHA